MIPMEHLERWARLGLVLVLAVLLVGSWFFRPQPEAVEASTVVGYNTTTLAGGTTRYGYTTTAYSDAYLGGGYGLVQVQGLAGASVSTATLTYTPQFSNQPNVSCAAVTAWFNGTAITATGTANTGAEYTILGRCVRVKITASSGYFTPTIYARFLNRN